MFTLKLTIAGATQFVDTSPILTFTEYTDLNAMPPNFAAHILGYSYDVMGTATTARLVARGANVARGTTEEVIFENRDGSASAPAVNSLSQICGPQGLVVPRRYGFEATVQPIPQTLSGDTDTYQLFFSTTLKDDDGTLIVWYKIGEISGAA